MIDLLAARVRRDGSRPLLTYYRPDRGERVEFSATSFANWVDKTANLLETLGVEGRVAGPVSGSEEVLWSEENLPTVVDLAAITAPFGIEERLRRLS